MLTELKIPDFLRQRAEEIRAAKASKFKNESGDTQVFHGEADPHYFGVLVKEPTAEEWLEAVRVYAGNPDGEEFVVAIKADDTLTLLHLGDFGVETGSKYLMRNPTATQAAEAVNCFLSPGTHLLTHRVAHRWDDNLSLFDVSTFDVVEPGEFYSLEQAKSEIELGMIQPDEAAA